jgi:hypothetical protein
MSENEMIVVKDLILGLTTYHMIKAKEVWAYTASGFTVVTEALPLKQAEAILKLLRE